jgi:hypothetical protein
LVPEYEYYSEAINPTPKKINLPLENEGLEQFMGRPAPELMIGSVCFIALLFYYGIK